MTSSDEQPKIPEDLREHYEECGKYQNAHLILCRQLIDRIATAEARGAELTEEQFDKVTDFVETLCALHCDKCLNGDGLLVNSAGKWSHSEGGNCCNNHSIYSWLFRWLSSYQRTGEIIAARTALAKAAPSETQGGGKA